MSLIAKCAQCDAPLGYGRSGHSWCDKCREEERDRIIVPFDPQRQHREYLAYLDGFKAGAEKADQIWRDSFPLGTGRAA
jgi:hypothetical protein